MEGLALFSTPMFRHDIDDAAWCAELAAAVLAEREASPGIRASNHGGAWHSAPDLAGRDEALWQDVAARIAHLTRETFDLVAEAQGMKLEGRAYDAGVQMWAMVMEAGGYAAVHEHHGAGWSVALYADAGDDDSAEGGAIAFVDPRRVPALSGGVPLYPSTFTVRPRTGMLLVFPGWLQHFVHPYRGRRPRVTISANLSFQPV